MTQKLQSSINECLSFFFLHPLSSPPSPQMDGNLTRPGPPPPAGFASLALRHPTGVRSLEWLRKDTYRGLGSCAQRFSSAGGDPTPRGSSQYAVTRWSTEHPPGPLMYNLGQPLQPCPKKLLARSAELCEFFFEKKHPIIIIIIVFKMFLKVFWWYFVSKFLVEKPQPSWSCFFIFFAKVGVPIGPARQPTPPPPDAPPPRGGVQPARPFPSRRDPQENPGCVVLTLTVDGVVRLWTESSMPEVLSFHLCCVLNADPSGALRMGFAVDKCQWLCLSLPGPLSPFHQPWMI